MSHVHNYYRCRCGVEWENECVRADEMKCPTCGVQSIHPYKRDEASKSEKSDSHKIAELNDTFRSRLSGGRVLLTAGVDAMSSSLKTAALIRTSTFSSFTPDNDPHGEHDFGSFEMAGETFFWKIDYFDKGLKHGSENPADETKTTRVLTLMLAQEY